MFISFKITLAALFYHMCNFDSKRCVLLKYTRNTSSVHVHLCILLVITNRLRFSKSNVKLRGILICSYCQLGLPPIFMDISTLYIKQGYLRRRNYVHGEQQLQSC